MNNMKLHSLFTLMLSLGFAASVMAADQKFDGKATCAKCDLGIAAKCQAAVIVTSADGKKETYLAAPSDKADALQAEVCGGGKPAEVTGTLIEKDGKKLLQVASYKIK